MKKQFLAAALVLVSQQALAGLQAPKEDPAAVNDTAATVKGGTAATVKNAAGGTAATVKGGTAATVKGGTAAVVANTNGATSPAPASINPEAGGSTASNCPLINSPNVGLLDQTTPKAETAAVGEKAPTLQ